MTNNSKKCIFVFAFIFALSVAGNNSLHAQVVQPSIEKKGADPKDDTDVVAQVKEFRTRPHFAKKFPVHGIYYDIAGFKNFADNFSGRIPRLIKKGFLTQKKDNNDTLYYKGGTEIPFTAYGLSDTLKNGDSLKVVIGFYWKRKFDPRHKHQFQFDFSMVPTLVLLKGQKDDRDGVIDYFGGGPLDFLYYHDEDKDDFDQNYYKILKGNASDNGTMFP
jgi:hypothetical protein